ncbi:hypothetical protein [Arenimonas alkanexedens]
MTDRFLTSSAAIESLKAPESGGVEQWVSCHESDGFRFISWIRIVQEKTSSPGKWTVYQKTSLDVGNEDFIDLDEFEEVGDPDEPEGKRYLCDSVEQALSLASSLGADQGRYVGYGELQFVYRDFFLANGPPKRGAEDWFR